MDFLGRPGIVLQPDPRVRDAAGYPRLCVTQGTTSALMLRVDSRMWMALLPRSTATTPNASMSALWTSFLKAASVASPVYGVPTSATLSPLAAWMNSLS